MASYCSKTCRLTFSRSPALFHLSPFTYVGRRYLLSREVLGLDSYQRMRKNTESLLGEVKDKFSARMENYLKLDQQEMVFTDDLKNMVALASSDTELNLVIRMIKIYHHQTAALRFGTYIFGPVVMRLFYYLNKPDEILQIIKDEELSGFFDQAISLLVAMDLLYNHKRYQNVLDVYRVLTQKSLPQTRIDKDCFILAAAACYQLNTPESHTYSLQLLKGRSETGADIPVRRAVTFLTALALNQNDPQSAREILALIVQSNYITVRNLKAMCFADLNRPEDALPLIRYSLERNVPFTPKKKTGDVCIETLEKIEKSIERLCNKDVRRQFDQTHKSLIKGGHICRDSLDQLLTQKIAFSPTYFRGAKRETASPPTNFTRGAKRETVKCRNTTTKNWFSSRRLINT